MGKLKSIKALWLIPVCLITFFVNNSVIVPDIMESRNIITAREMVYDGHWMIPTMNGELRLEKPPLPTWLTAVAEMVSSDDVGLQRAVAGLAAVLMVVFFYLLAVEFMHNKRYAFFSTLLLCTCYSIILMGRTASWDIYCHAFMLGAIYYLFKAFAARGPALLNFFLSGLFLGLSFMSKGPVSFYALLLPFLIAYIYFYRPSLKGKWRGFIVLLVTCLAVSSWWYLYIYLFHEDAMRYVIHKESGAWVDHNVRPWYYYWKFFLEAGVWSLLLLTALFLPLWSVRERGKREYLFPLVWLLLDVVLLSLMPEKKSRYLLPILIPASYVMGYLIVVWNERLASYRPLKADKALYRVNAWLLTGIVAVLPVAGHKFLYASGYMSLPLYVVVCLVIWVIAVYLGYAALCLRPDNMVVGIVLLFLAAECLVLPSLKHIINNPEMKSVALTQDMPSLNGMPFYYNQKDDLRIELVYAAHRKIRPLDMSKPDSILKVLPCAVLTHRGAAAELPVEIWQQVDSSYVGRFDDNRRPKGNKRFYSENFIYHITILKKK